MIGKSDILFALSLMSAACAADSISHMSLDGAITYPTNVAHGNIDESYIIGSKECPSNPRIMSQLVSGLYGTLDAWYQRNAYPRMCLTEFSTNIISTSQLTNRNFTAAEGECLGYAFNPTTSSECMWQNRKFPNTRRLPDKITDSLSSIISSTRTSGFASIYDLLLGNSNFSCHTFGSTDMGWSSSAILQNELTISESWKPTMSDVLDPHASTFFICLSECHPGFYGNDYRDTSVHPFDGISSEIFPCDPSETAHIDQIFSERSKENENLPYVSNLMGDLSSFDFTRLSLPYNVGSRMMQNGFSFANCALAIFDITCGNWGLAGPLIAGTQLYQVGHSTIEYLCDEGTVSGYFNDDGSFTVTYADISFTQTSKEISIDYTTTNSCAAESTVSAERTTDRAATFGSYEKDDYYGNYILFPSDDWDVIVSTLNYNPGDSMPMYLIEEEDSPYYHVLWYTTIDGSGQTITYTLEGAEYDFYVAAYGSATAEANLRKHHSYSTEFNPIDDRFGDPYKNTPAIWPHPACPVDSIMVTEFQKMSWSSSSGVSGNSYRAVPFTCESLSQIYGHLYQNYSTLRIEEMQKISECGLSQNISELLDIDVENMNSWLFDSIYENAASHQINVINEFEIYRGDDFEYYLYCNGFEIDPKSVFAEDLIWGDITITDTYQDLAHMEQAEAQTTSKKTIAVKWDFPAMKRTDSGQ